MFDLKIQCEHCPGTSYAWFTIAEWRCGVHSLRQLVSVCERYFRIREILQRIPEQTKASGTAVGEVPNANGIGVRAKHSFYAGVTGVRLAATLRSDPNQLDVVEQWLTREGKVPLATPDVAVMSNRQIGILAAPPKPPTVPPPAKLSPVEQRADRITSELLRPPSSPPPRRVIIDAPKPAPTEHAKPRRPGKNTRDRRAAAAAAAAAAAGKQVKA